MTKSKSKYVGVDGCTGGWFSIGLDDGDGHDMKMCENFDNLDAHYPNAELILVDMPIGLEDTGACNDRLCDAEAKELLKGENGSMGRSSSVFPPPSRELIRKAKELCDYNKVNLWSRREYKNAGVQLQSFLLWWKIDEVDDFITKHVRNSSPEIREVHPEVCFWALNNRKFMSERKKAVKGRSERLQVLCQNEPLTDKIYKEALDDVHGREYVSHDDILDALVAAVTAKVAIMQYHGKPPTIPDKPPKDSKGLPMEMVYVIPNSPSKGSLC